MDDLEDICSLMVQKARDVFEAEGFRTCLPHHTAEFEERPTSRISESESVACNAPRLTRWTTEYHTGFAYLQAGNLQQFVGRHVLKRLLYESLLYATPVSLKRLASRWVELHGDSNVETLSNKAEVHAARAAEQTDGRNETPVVPDRPPDTMLSRVC